MSNIDTNMKETQPIKKEENERLVTIGARIMIILVASAVFFIPFMYDLIAPYSESFAKTLIGMIGATTVCIIMSSIIGFIIQPTKLTLTKLKNILNEKRIRYLVYPIVFIIAVIVFGGLLWNFLMYKTVEIVLFINGQTTINDSLLKIVFSEISTVFPFLIYPINYCFFLLGIFFIVYKGYKKMLIYQTDNMKEKSTV